MWLKGRAIEEEICLRGGVLSKKFLMELFGI